MTAAVLIIPASCATTSERIKENTGRYNGRVVRLYGGIPVIVNIPLTGISIYQFRDKAGKAAAAAGKAIAGFLSVLGHVFIITENI